MLHKHNKRDNGERFNTTSHIIGAVLAFPAIIILVVLASIKGDPWRIVSFSIYGISLFLLYLFSSLYHGSEGRIKRLFKKLDHIAIYLLIAGTYTPFTLISLNGTWGWSLFGVIWSMALIGVVLDSMHSKGPRIAQMVLYLLMGWLILVAMVPMLERVPSGGLWLLLAGGLFYTFGIIFYALDNRIRHAHGIWHLFVLAGSTCHYLSLLLYLL